MLFVTFIKKIPNLKATELGGLNSQFKLAPRAPEVLIKAYKESKLKRLQF